MVEGELGCAFWGAEIIEAAPINNPIARQHRNRQGSCGRVRSKITDDLTRQTAKPENQSEISRGIMKDPVVAVGLPNHAMAESVGSGRKLDRHIGRLLEAIELTPIVQDPRGNPWLGETFHEVVEHHPLIVPCY